MIVEMCNVSFGYKRHYKTISNISLSVEKGSIYGFIGSNGAGKTTTIKLLLGLLKPDQGTIKLFSKDFANDYINIYKKVGALIGKPSLYERLSGRDNLKIQQLIRNLPSKKIDEVLQIVNLENAADSIVKEYSTGMKQRLGIAIALMSDPELIVLDEPTNALDPNGIVEIRETILRLNKVFNKTIFLSSHLLSEVEKLVTHLAIIESGSLKFQGSITKLQNLKSKKLNVIIETRDNDRSASVLSSYSVAREDDKLTLSVTSKEEIGDVIRLLTDNGITIYQAYIKKENLEDLFFDITQEGAYVK
ncbi:MAG: ABC transporter ATP-binding protein [Bacteroidota bacterium]|nr:ABC transporter ATP-binding protein [Bacteroidota bacterium]